MKQINFNLFRKSDHVPACLYARYRSLLFLALITVLIALGCAFTGVFSGILFPAVFSGLALSFLIMAVLYKRSLETRGYCRVCGTVTFIKEGFSPGHLNLRSEGIKRPSYYHVKTDDGEIFHVPADRRTELPLNSKVAVYAPLDVYTYERNGIFHFSSVWCCELLDE